MNSSYVPTSDKAINALTTSFILANASLVGPTPATTQVKANMDSGFVTLITQLHKTLPPSMKANIKQFSLKDRNKNLTRFEGILHLRISSFEFH